MTLAASENVTLADGRQPARAGRVRMSESEFYRLAEARVEFVNGEAVFMSPVSLFHNSISVFLARYLGRLVQSSNAGQVFFDSVTIRLSPEVSRVPDVVFVSTANSRAAMRENHIDGPPDLIIEIVSPESRTRDYLDKYHDYESAGVTEYWIIDPTYQTIDLYRLKNARYERISPEEPNPALPLTSTVLPGFVLKAEWLKQNPLPNPDQFV